MVEKILPSGYLKLRKALEKNTTLTHLAMDTIAQENWGKGTEVEKEGAEEIFQIKRLCEENKFEQDNMTSYEARFSLLRSFVSANKGHTFATSIRDLIPGILELAAINKLVKPTDNSEEYAIFLRENVFSLAVQYLAWLYISHPVRAAGNNFMIRDKALTSITLSAVGVIVGFNIGSIHSKNFTQVNKLPKLFRDFIQEALFINIGEFAHDEARGGFYIHEKQEFLICALFLKTIVWSPLSLLLNELLKKTQVKSLHALDKKLGHSPSNIYNFLMYSISYSYFTGSVISAIPTAALIMRIQHQQPTHKEKINSAIWLIMFGKLLNDFVFFLRLDHAEAGERESIKEGLDVTETQLNINRMVKLYGIGAFCLYFNEYNKINRSIGNFIISLLKGYKLLLTDVSRQMHEDCQSYASNLRNLLLRNVILISSKILNEESKMEKPLLLSSSAPANLRRKASEQTAADGTAAHTAAHTADRSHDKKIKPKSWCSRCSSCVLM